MGLLSDLKLLFAGDPAPGAKRAPVSGKEAGTVARGQSINSSAVADRLVDGGRQQIMIGTGELTYPIPFKLENRHFLVAGTTGSGKTRAYFQMFDQVRGRGTDKALIVDHGGEMIARYWRPGDVILNPYDARFPGWSPFNEIRAHWDHDNMGRFVIPDASGSSAEWNRYAQALYSAVSRRLKEQGKDTTAELLRVLLATPTEELCEFLVGDPIAAMLNPKNDKMVASVRGIVGSYLQPWRYMQDGAFSLRDWVLDDGDRRWVFLTYRDSMYAALRGFISMAVSIAIIYTLDLPEDEKRRIWFSLDEMASLDKISAISDALTKIRKRGGCVVAGLQTTSQVEDTYGREGAQTLFANFGTWLSLRPGDAATAETFSKHFGEQEIWHQDYTDGMSSGEKASTNEGVSTKLKQQRVVTPTELMQLPDLFGYIKFPGDLPLAEIVLPIIEAPNGRCAEPFQAASY